MSIGLRIIGRNSARSLDDIERSLRAQGGASSIERVPGEGDRQTLIVALHPGAPDVTIADRGGGAFLVEASTSSCGPGYHADVVDRLHRLGSELAIAWDEKGDEGEDVDDTGYFTTRDPERLIAAFRAWIQITAQHIDDAAKKGATGIALSMPADRIFLTGALLTTLMGPRDYAWLDAVRKDPSRGFDVFPWPNIGHGAEVPFGRAMVRLWCDVRFRRPLNDAEKALQLAVLDDLEEAHRLDPKLPFPSVAWRELIELTGRGESLVATRVAFRADVEKESIPVGYRRGDVRVRLSGGWSFIVPGSLAEEWEESGTWCAWDTERTVWHTSLTFTQHAHKTARETLALFPRGAPETPEEIERGALLVQWSEQETQDDDGAPMLEFAIRAAVPGEVSVISVCVRDAAQRDLAFSVIESIEHERS